MNGEKRAATRIPFGRRSAVLMQSGLMTVVIRELSVSGAGLVASRAVPVGEQLILCLPRHKGPDLRLKCSILRCERGTGERVFLVGLKFEEVLQSPRPAPSITPAAVGESPTVTRIRNAMLGT